MTLRTLSIRAFSLLDQVAFSAGNFVLTILLARYYHEEALAAYGIGLSLSFIIQSIQRNSFLVQTAVLAPEIVRRRASHVIAAQILWVATTTLLQIIVFAALILLSGGSSYMIKIAIASLVCSLLNLQLEFDRSIFLKHNKFMASCVSSFVFLAIMGALFFLIPRYGIAFGTMMATIALYSLSKSAYVIASISLPDFFWGWRLLKRYLHRNFGSSLISIVGYSSFNSIPIFILGAVSPPLQTAAYGAVRGLMQPLMIVIRSLDMVDKNYFQGVNSPENMRANMIKILLRYTIMSLSALIIMGIFAQPLVGLIYGEKYSDFSGLLIGWGTVFFLLALISPIETVVVKTKRMHAYSMSRIPAGIIGIITAALLCPTMGAWGAMIACILGWIVHTGLAIWIVRDILFLKHQKLP